MTWIENPFAGHKVGWTWDQHIAAGYHGGTDYIMYPPDQITAAADGVVKLVAGENGFTPGDAIFLELADGRSINYREVASATVKSGATVTRGQTIGNPNMSGRWPHIDATVNGTRVPFEPLVNTSSLAGDTITPFNNQEATVIRYQIDNPKSDPLVGHDFFVQPGVAVTHSATATQTSGLCYRHFAGATPADVPFVPISVADFALALAELGFPGMTAATIPAGATNYPAVGSGSAVLAGIAALDKQADDYQTALLTAIGGVDEATLATFGLKRA